MLRFTDLDQQPVQRTGRSTTVEQPVQTINNLWFQLQSISNAGTCIDQCFAVKNFGVHGMTSIFDLSNLKMKIQHAQHGSKFPRSDISYTVFLSSLIWSCGLVVNASLSGLGDRGLNSAECWNSLQPLGHFAWHLAKQRILLADASALYCCYITVLSFIETSQWQFSADRISALASGNLYLYMNIWLQLFWSTWCGDTWAVIIAYVS